MSEKNKIDIDELLQESWLTITYIQMETAINDGSALWIKCKELIEQLQIKLNEYGMDQSSIDHICYAQCALLDETILSRAQSLQTESQEQSVQDHGYAIWQGEPLQTHFFQTLQAGELLYERINDVLRESSPNLAVLTSFHRVLLLGFRGRYSDRDAPERRKIIERLSQYVTPLQMKEIAPLQASNLKFGRVYKLHSRRSHFILAGTIIIVVWLGLHHLLTTTLNSLSITP